MSEVLVISGSPSSTSKTERVGEYVTGRVAAAGWSTDHLRLRTLPAAPLLAADTSDPRIGQALEQVERAAGIVVATPTYKAAYSGLLKTFLDLLPQFGFAGKAVLPLATGGTTAHVLALDYGLRPVTQSLGPRHVVQSFFALDAHLAVVEDELTIDPASAAPLEAAIEQFRHALDQVPRPAVLSS